MAIIAAVFTAVSFRGLYELDYCEQVFQITDSDLIPNQGTGIAKYLSCMPEAQISFATSMGYQLYNEFEKGLILCNDRLTTLGIPYVGSLDDL